MPEDNKLRAELIQAVALELAELGYRPCPEPGHLQRKKKEPVKVVDEDVWRKVSEIVGDGNRAS
jgi:hypothetical protein